MEERGLGGANNLTLEEYYFFETVKSLEIYKSVGPTLL